MYSIVCVSKTLQLSLIGFFKCRVNRKSSCCKTISLLHVAWIYYKEFKFDKHIFQAMIDWYYILTPEIYILPKNSKFIWSFIIQ